MEGTTILNRQRIIYQTITPIMISENKKYVIMTSICSFLLCIALLFNNPFEIIQGMRDMILSPSTLITDYMKISNIGAALSNSSILMLFTIGVARKNKVKMNGTLIAVIFTMGGFALFGKNLYNSISILLGVYLHSRYQKEKFSRYIVIGFFGTALAPLVSLISFQLADNIILGIIVGNGAGLLAGFLLPPLAASFVKFHQGFSLYNIGFTCGIIGTFFMAFIRALGKDSEVEIHILEGYNKEFTVLLIIFFTIFILCGYVLNGRSLKGYIRLFRHSGRLIEDFVIMDGYPITLMNMGIMGLLMTGCILLTGGELNGATIGGILTVVGFSAFGKHPKNVIPVIVGVCLGALIQVWDIRSVNVSLAILFGTTLAPISGKFGPIYGIIAGFLHLTMVMNIGELHGGMNLYNNGFSGGLVAATLVPIIEAFRKEES